MLTFPITELDVEALIDSQLSWEEEKIVRREMEKNPALLAYYAQILHQKKLIVAWWLSEMRKPVAVAN
jgi:anti-sigma factor RsiW